MRARPWAVVVLLVALSGCGEAQSLAGATDSTDSTGAPTSTVVAETPSASTSPTVPGACPLSYDGLEPPDAAGVSTAGRLAPPDVPTAVLVCRYATYLAEGWGPTASALVGERELSGALDSVPDDLALPARIGEAYACPLNDQERTPYLVRLTYGQDRQLWVADTDRQCPHVATNGVFTSDQTASGSIGASFDSGTWTTDDLAQPCLGVVGRAGQDRELVPSGWDGVRICDGGGRADRLTPDQGRRLVSLWADLPTAPSDGSARCDADSPDRVAGGRHATVVFDYPRGRSVAVRVDARCDPPFDNRTLVASADRAVRTAVLAVLDE